MGTEGVEGAYGSAMVGSIMVSTHGTLTLPTWSSTMRMRRMRRTHRLALARTRHAGTHHAGTREPR